MKAYLFIISCFFFCFLTWAEELSFETLRQKWKEYRALQSGTFNEEDLFFRWYQDLKKEGHFLADTPENRQFLQQELHFSEIFATQLLEIEKTEDVFEKLMALEKQNQSLQKQLLALQEQLQKLEAKQSLPPVLKKEIRKNIKNPEEILDLSHQKDIMIEIENKTDKEVGEYAKVEGQTYKIFRRGFHGLQDGDKNFEIYIDASGEDGNKISERLQEKINTLLQEKLKDGQAKVDLEIFQIDPKKEGNLWFGRKPGQKQIEVKGEMILEDRDGNKKIYRFDPTQKTKGEPSKKQEIKVKKAKKGEAHEKQIFIYGNLSEGPLFPPFYFRADFEEESPYTRYLKLKKGHSLYWAPEAEQEEEECDCEECLNDFDDF